MDATSPATERELRFRRSLERLAPHDHVCLVFDSDAELERATSLFLAQGLAAGDRCVRVVEGGGTDRRLVAALEAAGVEVAAATARGALDLDRAHRPLDPEATCALLLDSAGAATASGFRALRVALPVTWAPGGDPDSERVVACEARVNGLMPRIPCLALCLYDRRRSSPAVLREVIRTHPWAVIDGRLCRNHYYVPPADLGAADGGAREVERLLRNVLERAEAEDALHAQEQRLELVLEGAQHMFWDLDVRADHVVYERRLAKAMGFDATPQDRSLRAWRARIHPDDREMVVRDFTRHMEGSSRSYSQEYRVRMADGQFRWISSRGRVVERDAAGQPLRVVGTMTDVTERHRLREQLELSTRLASVGTLAAGVAHEINNPLTFVDANLRWAIDELSGRGDPGLDEVTTALREAVDGAERMRDIVKNLRRLTQRAPETGPAPADVLREVKSAIAVVRRRVEGVARLTVDLAEQLPLVRVQPHQLGQVLVNLLVNAAQALPDGHAREHEVHVTARAEADALVLEVRDTGHGIPPDVLPRIFDPFFTTKAVGTGTGLGLAICDQIVRAAGGRIEVESTPGHGTTVRVHLPAAPAA